MRGDAVGVARRGPTNLGRRGCGEEPGGQRWGRRWGRCRGVNLVVRCKRDTAILSDGMQGKQA